MELNVEDKLAPIKEDHDFIRAVIDLIPSSFYFSDKRDTVNRLRSDLTNDNEVKDGEEQSHKNWKRFKFDPANTPTVSNVQEKITDANTEKHKPKKKKNVARNDNTSVSPVSHLEELRERFRLKLEGLQKKRNALNKTDYLEKKKMKRRESKLKHKLKKKIQNQNKPLTNGEPAKERVSPCAKPIYNHEGKMVFSKFDFQKKGKADTETTGKNYRKLLQLAESKREHMAKLRDEDEEKASKVEQKNTWKQVLQKAEGVKVRDDPDLLKKSLKRKEKRKHKVHKDWDQRKDKTEKMKQERQDKRRTNINKKKQARVDKKIKKGKKKGHIVPGV